MLYVHVFQEKKMILTGCNLIFKVILLFYSGQLFSIFIKQLLVTTNNHEIINEKPESPVEKNAQGMVSIYKLHQSFALSKIIKGKINYIKQDSSDK